MRSDAHVAGRMCVSERASEQAATHLCVELVVQSGGYLLVDGPRLAAHGEVTGRHEQAHHVLATISPQTESYQT